MNDVCACGQLHMRVVSVERKKGGPLEVEPGRRYEVDQDMIPTGRLLGVDPGPWNETFVDLHADPVIRWGDAVELEVSSTFDHWVILSQFFQAGRDIAVITGLARNEMSLRAVVGK